MNAQLTLERTRLKLFHETDGTRAHRDLTDREKIAEALSTFGARFELWQAGIALAQGAGQEDVLRAYQGDVGRIMEEGGFKSVDVIRMAPDHPDRVALRAKFLAEHTHSDDEVRFFVEGAGAFYLHKGDEVAQLVCTAGDLISVPAGMTHWFDAGERPRFCAIRIFTSPEGWVANYSGSDIATRFPAYMNV